MKKRISQDRKKFNETIKYLKTKKRILFLTTSNRWEGQHELPKSTQLAFLMKKKLGKKVTLIEVPKLKIYPCEGNVSTEKGNNCGVKESVLKDKFKNPSGCHRCWASINNRDDELWKISKPLLESDCVVFFASVRWGQTNSIYQKLIERLDWIENRHTTLEEKSITKNMDAGIIIVGQNWNGKNVLKTQKKVLYWFGFKIPKELSWNWQFTKDYNDESEETYKLGVKTFKEIFVKK